MPPYLTGMLYARPHHPPPPTDCKCPAGSTLGLVSSPMSGVLFSSPNVSPPDSRNRHRWLPSPVPTNIYCVVAVQITLVSQATGPPPAPNPSALPMHRAPITQILSQKQETHLAQFSPGSLKNIPSLK